MHGQGFRLEISNLEDFIAFVAIIQGEDFDKIKELTKRLNKSTEDLLAAQKENKGK